MQSDGFCAVELEQSTLIESIVAIHAGGSDAEATLAAVQRERRAPLFPFMQIGRGVPLLRMRHVTPSLASCLLHSPT